MLSGADTADAALLFHYDLSDAAYGETVSDLSGNGYNMLYEKMWLTQSERDAIFAEDEQSYAYTIAFIPDIQISTRLYYSRLKPIYDFLINNKESMNIQYAISLGDLTDNNTVEEWDRVNEQYNRLNGIVPYALIRGNHDIERNKGALLYDQYFSTPNAYYYNHVKSNGGFYDDSNTQNTYLLFSVGQVDYLILNLDFGASDDVLTWADKILSQYPEHRVIVVTHGYIQSNGKLLTADASGAPSRYNSAWNDADDMWDKLIRKHENIDLVACGHIGVDHIVCTENTGDNGNVVYQMLSDTQYVDRKILGAGIVTCTLLRMADLHGLSIILLLRKSISENPIMILPWTLVKPLAMLRLLRQNRFNGIATTANLIRHGNPSLLLLVRHFISTMAIII